MTSFGKRGVQRGIALLLEKDWRSGGILQFQKSPGSRMRQLERGAGFFLLGAWGCPPTLKFPQDWGT
jgi:hypothetical protein